MPITWMGHGSNNKWGVIMKLRQKTLFAPAMRPDEISIERIREFEPPEGYHVAFSGGKDSIVILDLVKRAGVKFDAHYSLTTVDPPELVHFVKTFPEVEIHRPELTMWQLIVKKTMPPTRRVRFCCQVLKENKGKNRLIITGIRWAESYRRRARRRLIESCQKGERRTFLNPIIDWSESEVWEYIRERNLPYCSLYDEGFKRLGCIMCPMTGTKGMLKTAERWPKYYNAYLRAFEKMLIRKRERIGEKDIKWQTAEDVMFWWIYGHHHKESNPMMLFE